jgi:hypothetical protein
MSRRAQFMKRKGKNPKLHLVKKIPTLDRSQRESTCLSHSMIAATVTYKIVSLSEPIISGFDYDFQIERNYGGFTLPLS